MTDGITWATAFGEELRVRRMRAGLSVREAAKEAGFSEGLWRQLEKGYRQVTADVRVPATPTADKVLRAARALDWFELDALHAAGLKEDAAQLERYFYEQAMERHEQAVDEEAERNVASDPHDEPVVAFPDPADDPGARPVTEARLREEMDRVHDELSEIKRLLSER